MLRRPTALSTARRLLSTPAVPGSRPGPIPLGDNDAQREMDKLIRRAERKAIETNLHQDAEREPLPAHPDNRNPETGEVDGPKGPEPTRYGDWERKGRVYDF